MVKICIYLFPFLLLNCTSAYKHVKSADSAMVRFIIPETEKDVTSVGVYINSDSSCSGATKVRQLGGVQLGGMASSDAEIGMPKDPKQKYSGNSYAEISVVPAQPLYFTLAGMYFGKKCKLTMFFVPKSNTNYEVRYTTEGRRCNILIDEIELKNAQLIYREEVSAKRNPKTCSFYWN